MTDLFDWLMDGKDLSPQEVEPVRALSRVFQGADSVHSAAAVAVLRARRDGHVCLSFSDICKVIESWDGREVFGLENVLAKQMEGEIRSCAMFADPNERAPFIVDRRGLVYLRRLWVRQEGLAKWFATRIRSASKVKGRRPHEDEEQAHAQRSLAVVTGGPGSGKTYTVAKVLAKASRQARLSGGQPLKVRLLAPTGKAAVRLRESISRAKDQAAGTEWEEDYESIPNTTSTIHRALAKVGSTRGRGQVELEAADVVVVDEASMVDLSLMWKLVSRISPNAQVLLLGDPDQLASVEAGSILGDFCAAAKKTEDHFLGTWVVLEGSRRFAEHGGVADLARAIRGGDYEGVLSVLEDDSKGEVALVSAFTERAVGRELLKMAWEGAWDDLLHDDPARRLECFERTRVLTALRKGPFGAERINTLLDDAMRQGRGRHAQPLWYDGRPVIVEENQHELELYNGDMGVYCESLNGVVFWGKDSDLRVVHPSLMSRCSTAFATTVHKAQGSEHDRVVIVLPERFSRVLSRELLYTAVTRARRGVAVLSSTPVLRATVETRAKRKGALGEMILEELSRGF